MNKEEWFAPRIESRKHEMKKKNTKKEENKKTIGARGRVVKRIFPWNPKESVISVIRKFRGIRVFSYFRDSKTQQK